MKLVVITFVAVIAIAQCAVVGDGGLGGINFGALLAAFQKLNLLSGGLNGPDHVKDTVIYGRSIRITEQSGCVKVKDLASSFSSTKCANTTGEATAAASSELFSLLIRLGQVSYDELGLKPPTPKPVKQACRDNFSARKCKLHIDIGHCDPSSQFFKWIHTNCYKSCGGCLTMAEITGDQ